MHGEGSSVQTGRNGGGGRRTIVRGEEVKATYFPGSKSCK